MNCESDKTYIQLGTDFKQRRACEEFTPCHNEFILCLSTVTARREHAGGAMTVPSPSPALAGAATAEEKAQPAKNNHRKRSHSLAPVKG